MKTLNRSPKKIFLFICFILISFITSAQTCKNVDKECPRPKEKGFVKSGVSHSTKIKPKQKKLFNINMFEGKEYYISVCGKSIVGNLQLRILSSDNKLMYDNAVAGLDDKITIQAAVTQTLIVEVSAPLGTMPDENISCLGIYVASRNYDRK